MHVRPAKNQAFNAKRIQKHAVNKKLGGMSSNEVSVSMGGFVSARTVRAWHQHYEIHNELPCETTDRKKRGGPRENNRKMTVQSKTPFCASLKSTLFSTWTRSRTLLCW